MILNHTIQGDALTTLKTLPTESVDCIITSPPYWGLRDYGVSGQLGLEDTPEAFVANMVQIFDECRRVLKKEGTLWPSNGLELIGFELKTSRADWLRELKQPDKADPIKQFCDRWYLVIDASEIVRHYSTLNDTEVPEDWGLMVPDYSSYPYKLKIKKEAPKLDPKPLDRLFVASLMRRAATSHDEFVINGRTYKLQ